MTNFGIALRKIRLDKQELLRDMAAKLKVSSAFLSAVENGKKKAPAYFIDEICKLYDLDSAERMNLIDALELSTQEVKIDLERATPTQRETAVSFAKALNNLTDEQLIKIMSVFETKKK